MRIATGLFILAATTATATAAFAEARLSDAEYIKAARCRGLAGSENLGVMDTASLDAMLKAQGRGRVGFIIDKADEARETAERAARRAGPEGKPGLLAQRATACAGLMG